MDNVRPYEGTEPYIFLSYAHADASAVMAIAARLQEAGFRIWYDGGIEVGSEWPEYIAAHLEGAAVMLAFLSNAYVRSDNCRKEMHFAQTRKISTVNIFLEETALTPGMEMQIGPLFALMKHTMGEEVFYKKLLSAPQLAPLLGQEREAFQAQAGPVKRKKRRTPGRIAALCVSLALLIAAVTLGIIGFSTGYAQRIYIKRHQPEIVTLSGDTEISFKNARLDSAARTYAGAAEGPLHVSDLTDLRELTLEAPDETALSELRYFPDLKRLTLIGMQAEDLRALPVCGLEVLILRDSRVTDLSGVGNLPLLRELDAEGCPIRELGSLSHCLQLRRLRLAGADVRSFAPLKTLTVLAEAEIHNAGLNELRPLMRLSNLTDLSFTNCDLRGRFFKRFDREWNIVTLSLTDCELNSTKNLEDFTGLRELTLIRSGEKLDWSALAGLSSLRMVTADKTMESVLREALANTGNLTELIVVS
ncbi:MAG: TIR domain-containing protein [Oscillospiraceae bacterium]|nr:TIR domain-containing protein [Oscillospiraceae bacterium]